MAEKDLLLEEKELLEEKRRLMAQSASHAQRTVPDEVGPPVTQYNFFDQGMPGDSLSRNVGEPFIRGVAGLADLPATIVNAALTGIEYGDAAIAEAIGMPPSDRQGVQVPMPFTELGEKAGIIAPEGERAEGFVARAAEFTGASSTPLAAAIHYGAQALKSLSSVPSLLSNIGRATAANPVKATAFDIAANVSAAGGGTIARANTDNEAIIAMSELGAAFIPTAFALLPTLVSKYTMTGKAYDKIKELAAPWSEEGAMYAASARMQDVAQDPAQAARRAMQFDEEGNLAETLVDIPIALRTEDPGIIKLQNLVLSRFPARQKQYSEELQSAIDVLSRSGNFPGGDVEMARHVLNVRQQMAVENASQRLAELGPNATPRQISSVFREEISLALKDAQRIEKQLWESIDSTLPGDLTNSQKAYDDLIATASPDAKDPPVPAWLAEKLSPQVDPRLQRQLDRQGWVGADGEISPAIMSALEADPTTALVPQRTFNDIKQIRSDVRRAITEERAAPAPNRNRIRALASIESGLLDDMAETGAEGVVKARDFSRSINERYRQGRVGRLMGHDVTGAERVEGQDLLDDVWTGAHRATNTQKLAEMTSSGPDQVLSYIKGKYIESVYGGVLLNQERRISPAAHKAFVENLRKSGMFETFPELEVELHAMYTSGTDALKLDMAPAVLPAQRARAAVLLGARPGEEMATILNAKDPAVVARSIMKRMHAAELSMTDDGQRLIHAPDQMARQGLKTAFVEEILRRSGASTTDATGRIVPNGNKAIALLSENDDVMNALQFTDVEKSRALKIADELRIAQLTSKEGTDIGSTVLGKGAPKLIETLARIMGAQAGRVVAARTGGGTVQTPGIFSAEAQRRILSLSTSAAEELIIESFQNPQLFRALMMGPRAGAMAKKRAEKELMAALVRLESAGRFTAGIASAQEFEDYNRQEAINSMPELQEN